VSQNENPLIAELESLKGEFLKTVDKLAKDIHRHDKIMARSDKRQQQEYDELQKKFEEVAALQKEIEDTQKEVVFTMGAIGESRSKETGNHVKRVAEYSKLFALYYGLDEKEAEMLKQASPMHDIGKVAIADAILNKPAKLTEEEFKIMQKHSELGYDMLKHSERPLLKCAATVAYEHHEKYNGRGYPRGIKGENIHIHGRITAIADVFDALGSDRCYKKAWDDDKIFELFHSERGEHFDPKLVDIFFEHLDEFLTIRDTLRDSE
jgi:response regulator RpfG family c-di-GMP phosphodiesterase